MSLYLRDSPPFISCPSEDVGSIATRPSEKVHTATILGHFLIFCKPPTFSWIMLPSNYVKVGVVNIGWHDSHMKLKKPLIQCIEGKKSSSKRKSVCARDQYFHKTNLSTTYLNPLQHWNLASKYGIAKTGRIFIGFDKGYQIAGRYVSRYTNNQPTNNQPVLTSLMHPRMQAGIRSMLRLPASK